MEKWYEMKARHMREKIELVQSLAESRFTQTQASKILGMELSALNNFIRRNNLNWPFIQQGTKCEATIATAWNELAEQERVRHKKEWGRIVEKTCKQKKIVKHKGTYNPQRLSDITEMVSKGFKTADIARELGISESSIRYWRKQYNLN